MITWKEGKIQKVVHIVHSHDDCEDDASIRLGLLGPIASLCDLNLLAGSGNFLERIADNAPFICSMYNSL